MSHIRKEAREGTSRYLSDRLAGTSGRVKNLDAGRTTGPSGSTVRMLERPSSAKHSSPRAQHEQHLMRQPRHNLHNCRNICIQPNVPPRTPIITLARPSKHHATVISSSPPSRRTTSETAHTTLKRGKSRDRRVQHT